MDGIINNETPIVDIWVQITISLAERKCDRFMPFNFIVQDVQLKQRYNMLSTVNKDITYNFIFLN